MRCTGYRGRMVTKTALNIDREKVELAAAVLGTTGTTETIDAALTEIIARDGRAKLMQYMSALDQEQVDAILHSWD